MESGAKKDLCFIADEIFDFDVSLSPASFKGDEDEDEVFVGPLSHKERCVSVNVASRLEGGGGVHVSLSPLTGELLEAVCQEAHKLADQLQSQDRETDADTNSRDEFLQDAEAKLGVLVQGGGGGGGGDRLSPIKRQTFLVQDSPMKELPPAVQRRMMRGSSTNSASSVSTPSIRPTQSVLSNRGASISKAASNRTNTRLSTSSPVALVKAQPKTGLRGKAALGVVLPSKPANPTASATKSRAEKNGRLQPPSKVGDKTVVGSWKRSPSSRLSSRAGSCDDLLSDSASVASDVSDSSLNSSLLGKRSMAPPSKSFKRNPSAVKVPPLQTRRTTDRRNSSSSSSVSSFNSSMSLSPAKGKLNSSLNRSISGPTGPAPRSVSKPANPRPTRSSVYGTAAPASTTAGRRSLSTQMRRPSEVEQSKTAKSTPLKKTVATPVHMTPNKRVLERSVSVPTNATTTATATTRLQSGLKTKPKPEAMVLPTPSGGFKGPPHKDDVSKMLKPKRLTSCSSADSFPQKPSAAPLTPSAGGVRSLQVKPRRPSTLPTPVKRRMSAIPPATPTNLTRPFRSSSVSSSGPAPSLSAAKREKSCSPAPAEPPVEEKEEVKEKEEVEVVVAPEIQPFCLEEEEEPPQSDQSESTEPAPAQSDPPQPSRDLIQLEASEENSSRTQEVLLLDLPAPILQPQEKLLIDLTNTPDLTRTSSKSCTTNQLIDLSSPLIKWSPEEKRENNAPLINLSF